MEDFDTKEKFEEAPIVLDTSFLPWRAQVFYSGSMCPITHTEHVYNEWQ